MNLTLERLGRTVLDLLYPPSCVLCGRGGAFICQTCLSAAPRADGLRCDRCWLPLRGADCARCAERPLALSRLRSVFRYEGDVQRLVHDFKFSGYSCLAEPLADEMAMLLQSSGLAPDVIVPVPLTGSRRRERGFNQAALLTKRIAKACDARVEEALARRQFRSPQRALTAAERWRNVEGAFSVALPDAVDGRRVLLIDDVATTGATLDACARVLLEAGASAVDGLTLARED
jgi:ComF family protein